MLRKPITLVIILCMFAAPSLLFGRGSREHHSLRIGMMPAVNSVPLIVAEHDGLFEDEGVDVELVLFKSQFYREAALQAGEIDGTISDMVNAINGWSNGSDAKVVIHTQGLFGLLAAPEALVQTIDGWRSDDVVSVRTGLLEDSIIFYVAERMLSAHDADPGKIDIISTLNLPSRLEMLLANQLEAAVLPEPMTRVAMSQGAHLIADTTVLAETPGVLLFTGSARAAKAGAIEAAIRAYDRAVEHLKADADSYRDVIVEVGEFPEAVRDTLVLPSYTPARAPSHEMLDDVAAWMMQKGLIAFAPTYQDVVDTRFLPE